MEAWILCNKAGPHSIKLTMQKLIFPLELPTISHNIVCEKTILVVVSQEYFHMSLVRYRKSWFWGTFLVGIVKPYSAFSPTYLKIEFHGSWPKWCVSFNCHQDQSGSFFAKNLGSNNIVISPLTHIDNYGLNLLDTIPPQYYCTDRNQYCWNQ